MTALLEDRMAELPPAKAANWLLYAVCGFVAVFLLWAAFAQLDVAVRGQGRVVPSSQLQVVSNLEGGIIEKILVQPGEVVKEGDALVALDPTETGSTLSAAQASTAALDAKIARLEAEVQGRAPNFPTEGSDALMEQVAIERSLYASRQSDLSSLTNAARARVSQAERSVAEAQAAESARRENARAAQDELNLIRPLVEKGIEPRLSLIQAESRAAVAQSDLSAASAGVTRAQAAVSEARASLSQQVQDWRSRAAAELANARGELAAKRQQQPALQGRLDRTTLRAPLSGRVNRVLKSTVGGSVAPGEPIVEIVPSDEVLLVEAKIRTKDIGWIALGQKAKVNITAYDPTVYGGLDGEVVTISPDAQIDERTGESFYDVEVRTSAEAITEDNGTQLRIGPGMTAEVALIGEKRSVLSYILRPFTRLKQRAFTE
ncbi:HlyD family type I secretion periplasmic adaptor subunit [Croceicoccus mobilis]|uniref:Membrane fusion protein (MFP) family protein n=1 Tax=Croceicoccus mobilis TaxID=1703339 RepID=A0A916YT89_9SPHN|nr:HlyD family type I secretion periplasmic adaptor subunit [Croceicoccus mobilis]GGD60662.1 HlyD family type I secretion membrane fusion protein [Croceicoccus mobilis]